MLHKNGDIAIELYNKRGIDCKLPELDMLLISKIYFERIYKNHNVDILLKSLFSL